MINATDFDIVGSYNNQRITSIDGERSVNVFEYHDPLAKKSKTLITTSGLVDANLSFPNTTGGFRTSFYFNGVTYHIIGNKFWRIDETGTSLSPTLINAALPLNTSSGYVGIDANTFQIILVDGVRGYIYDTIDQTFVQITDSNFPAIPLDVCYLDGFFVVINGNTNQFQLSTFNQGLVWGPASNIFTTNFGANSNLTIGSSTIGGASGTVNYLTSVPVTVTNSGGSLPAPLAIATTYYAILVDSTHIRLATSAANAMAGIFIVLSSDGSGTQTITSDGQLQLGEVTSHPGTLVACRTLHRRLFLFSQFFTEVWENNGIGTTLPFRRNNSLLMECGTPAIGSISVGFDIMMFQSQTRDGLGAVMQVNGAQPTPISTRALDFQLNRYARAGHISDCRGFLIRDSGLVFYRMNFTLANHTFVYNASQSNPAQDETKYWHEEEILNGDRHPSQTHVYFNGINYVGNYATPILYSVNSMVYTNAGEAIRRMRIARPVVPPGYQRIRIDRFQLDLLQGQLQNQGMVHLNITTENNINILTEDGNELVTTQTLPIDTDEGDPRVFLSISKDGGQTYGNLISAPMGLTGERTFRTVWRKLGTTKRGQAFVVKIEFFNDLPFVVLGAAWAMAELPE